MHMGGCAELCSWPQGLGDRGAAPLRTLQPRSPTAAAASGAPTSRLACGNSPPHPSLQTSGNHLQLYALNVSSEVLWRLPDGQEVRWRGMASQQHSRGNTAAAADGCGSAPAACVGTARCHPRAGLPPVAPIVAAPAAGTRP